MPILLKQIAIWVIQACSSKVKVQVQQSQGLSNKIERNFSFFMEWWNFSYFFESIAALMCSNTERLFYVFFPNKDFLV